MNENEEIIKRDSFVFYRSFKEAINELNKSDKLTLYEAISDYALDSKKPNLKGCSKALFNLIKPQIDANIRRRENGFKGKEYGNKGGAPIGNKNAQKQPQNNPKTTPNVNDNDNVNENVSLIEKSEEERTYLKISKSYKNVMSMEFPLTLKQWEEIVSKYGYDLAIAKISEMENYQRLSERFKSAYVTLDQWCKLVNEKHGR